MHWFTDVLKKWKDFSGRATRKEYWMFVLLNAMIAFGLVFVLVTFSVLFEFFLKYSLLSLLVVAAIIYTIFALVLVLPNLAVTVRRLHDTSRSGWWILISFLPYVGSIILLVFLCLDSEPDTNQYGPNPNGLSAPAPTPSAPVVEKASEVPMQDEVVINDIPLAEPAALEKKI